MNKLLVSDYDGTFYEDNNEESVYSNRDATIEYINHGNLFAFASGRNFNSIKGETDKYSIPYHYLICNNGTSIFDSKDRLIHYKYIPYEYVIKTINYLNKKHVIISYIYHDIYGNEMCNHKDVAEIICTVDIPSPEILEEVKQELVFLQTLFFTSDNSQVHTITKDMPTQTTQYLIIKEPSDKKEAIRHISLSDKISSKDIYTIGNDFNDYGMLECYNGYKMINSRSELELLDVPQISSVSKLIRRIEG